MISSVSILQCLDRECITVIVAVLKLMEYKQDFSVLREKKEARVGETCALQHNIYHHTVFFMVLRIRF